MQRIDAVLARMAELGLLLEVHGEVTDPDVDVFDREARFIERVLAPLSERHPQLRIVFEHITTRTAVDFVLVGAAGDRRHHDAAAPAAEPQRAVCRRHPAASLLPAGAQARGATARRCSRRWRAATRASSSAPTARRTRAAPRRAPAAAPVSSPRTPASSCTPRPSKLAGRARRGSRRSPPFHGADFYGLPRNSDTLTLLPEPWDVPAHYPFAGGELVPLRAGERIGWRLAWKRIV